MGLILYCLLAAVLLKRNMEPEMYHFSEKRAYRRRVASPRNKRKTTNRP